MYCQDHNVTVFGNACPICIEEKQEIQVQKMNTSQAICLAYELMAKYDLFKDGWKFDISRGKSTNGMCYSSRKLITISKYYIELNTKDKVQNTILHEIAHALVGCKHNHDEVWRAKAVEIGCSGERCTSNTVHHAGDVVYACPNCKRELFRHRAFNRGHMKACGKCCKAFNGGRYDERFQFKRIK